MKSMKKILIFAMLFMTTAVVMAQGLLNRPGMRRFGGRNLAQNQPAAVAGQPAVAPAGAAGEAGAAEPGGRSIEFNATPVDLVFKVYGELVKKTILKDPQVPQATVTLQPRQGQELSDEDKIEAIETVLEMNGIHLEPFGDKFVRALPRKSVRKEGIPLYLDEKALEADVEAGKIAEGKVISFMVRFKYMSEEDMEQVASKVLESFKSDSSGAPLVLKRGRQILVTDTYVNIKRMLEILPEIDVQEPAEPLPEVECIQIQNAVADDIVTVIEKIVADSLKEQEERQKKGGQVQNTGSQNSTAAPARPLLGGLRRSAQSTANQQSTSPAALVINASEAAHGIIKGRVTAIADSKSNKIILITKAENMQLFKKIIEALDVKTTLDTDVKVYRLKYAEAEDVSDMFNDLIGNSSSSKDSKGAQNQNAKAGTNSNLTRNTTTGNAKSPANKRTGDPSAGELNKENTTVLADKRINGLVVMTTRELFPTVEKIIESMDIKLSQVLIETAIIEVSLGDNLDTGVNWARMGDKKEFKTETPSMGSHGLQKYWYRNDDGEWRISENIGESYTTKDKDDNEVRWTRMGEGLVDTASEWVRNGFMSSNGKIQSMLGGGGASEAASGLINTLVGVGTNALDTVSPAGSGLNWFFKSDALNIAAVVQASKTDSRSKYIASPVVMTLDNKEAVINATEMSYLLKGFTAQGNSYSTIAVPDYEQKELGIEIKVTPKINPNGTVMLTVESKYTQIGADQKIKYSAGSGENAHLEEVGVPTTITREMSSDVLLENMQSVVFGGLTQNFKKSSETGIPILKDIPIIGKWLFGSVSERETRTELLVFMTPYVLDEGAAAQAEALRRKKTMSDPRPWEENGWSLSPLAYPVSKQEQMRRIKEEWKKQDEERKTKIAIEKMKVERAKKLQEMSKEERDLWLKMHKKELDDEAREELEEKMLDKDSQEELKKLAEQIKAKKLGAAEKEIKKAEAETAAENERGKLDAEKKAKESSQRILESADKELKKLEAPAIGGK